MRYLIEQIQMKPMGFLAAWRYVNIFFDDQTGLIDVAEVSGKPFPNLPCLADYRKNNRPTYPNDTTGQPLIKEMCNFVTHTNYRLYATDCTPYVIVQSEVNATQCGYNTVLPTPGLPTLPFPTPPYGLYKFIDFCEAASDPNRILVNFYKKNYSGAVVEITKGSGDPVRFNVSNNGDVEYGIRTTEAEVSLIEDDNFQLSDFYTYDEAEYKAEILYGGELKFSGFVIPDSCARPFRPSPNEVVIRLTDCIGGLEKTTFPLPLGSILDLRLSKKDVLCYALYMTRLNLDIHTVVNLYSSEMQTGIDDDPMALAEINPALFGDSKGQIDNCYEVIRALCEAERAILKQENGVWVFNRTCEMAWSTTRKRVYDYTGLFLRSELVTGTKSVGTSEAIIIEAGAEQSIGNAYKRVEVLLDYGNVPANILNGDFETWDGNNFQFWTKYGGVAVSRVERSVLGSQGVIGLNNYACQFDEGISVTKYLQADPIPVLKGDKINFKLLAGPKFPINIRLKIRFQVGSYCLYNDENFNNNQEHTWENELAVTTLLITAANNPKFVTLSIPEIPISGNLIIQVFGFIYTDSESVGQLFWIDNIGISKNSTQGDYDVTGSLAVSEQLNFYTNKPEILEIKYGDYEMPTSVSPTVQPGPSTSDTVQNNIYATYNPNGSYTNSWFEWGVTGKAVPFNLANARAGLRINRQPFIQMRNCKLRGLGLGFFDIYNIIVADTDFELKAFIVLSGSYSLKYQTFSGTLREIIKGNILSNDAVSPFLPGQLAITIMSDPNSVPRPDQVGGIFTSEFTQEFV